MYQHMGWIYFALDPDTNRIKIGKSADIKTRIKALRTANPNLRMVMYYQSINYSAIEKKYHQRFSQ